MTCLYTGWIMDITLLKNEIAQSAPFFEKKIFGSLTPGAMWVFFIRYVCPIVIGLVLLSTMGLLG
jgi:NSS family neurotransmitter:Na+ symporter